MRKTFELRYHLAYFIALLAIVSASFGRGLYLLLFFLPLFMSYLLRRKGRVVLRGREGNIIAGLMTLGFIPLFFLQDVFVMALYYLLGLLSVKLFVSFGEKDYDHVTLLGFLTFSMSTTFLYSIWYMILYVLFILFLTFYLFIRIVPTDQILDRKVMQYMLFVFPLIIISAVLLFILLPRNPSMLFGSKAITQSGDFADLKVGMFEKENLSERVLFRVKPQFAQDRHLYIRLKVFTLFNGKEWSIAEKWKKEKDGRVIIGGNPGRMSRNYKVYLSARFSHVPLVDYPVLLLWNGGRFDYFPDLMQVKINRLPGKNRYTVFAISQPPIPLLYGSDYEYLQIPPALRGHLTEILRKIDFSRDTLGSIIEFLRKNHRYGRFTPQVDTLMPIIEFLIYNRPGECTEFATSFVLLARMAGYKARLVAGFLTEEFNTLGKYFVVREKHAHAWAEVFRDGRWVRYDPTPPSGSGGGLAMKIKEYYDFIQYLWFTKVVEYNYQDQMRIALKFTPYSWRLKTGIKKLAKYVFTGIFVMIFAGYLIFAFLLVPFEQRAVLKFVKYMEKKGFQRKKGETIMELAKRSKDKKAIEFVTEYYRVRYGKYSKNTLKQILKSL